MKNVQVTQDARDKVTSKELTKSIRAVAVTTERVGFMGTLGNGLRFIVQKTKVLLI